MNMKELKTIYKFIYFEEDDFYTWVCRNKKTDDALGTIYFYKLWEQFVFQPDSSNVIFSTDCLQDIRHFIQQLKEYKKEKDFIDQDEHDRKYGKELL